MASNHPRYSNLYTSFGLAASGVASTDSGTMKILTIFNTATVDRYIMVFDRKTPPTLNTRPLLCFPVYANNGYTELNESVLTEEGQVFDLGLAWGMSTTPAAFTPADPTDAFLSIRWA